MFDLHLRNAAHENKNPSEGIEAYNLRTRIFFRNVLLRRSTGNCTNHEIVEHIQHYWALELVHLPNGHIFVTSDHPSIWTSVQRPDSLDLITMPITPWHTAVGYDRRVVEVVSNEVSDEDEGTLNVSQAAQATTCVYSSQELNSAATSGVREQLQKKSGERCQVSGTNWRLALQSIGPEYFFSFLIRVPYRL
jgi:hypothetical protein